MNRFLERLARYLPIVGLVASIGAPAIVAEQNAMNLVFDGDSIAVGLGAPPGHGLAEQTVACLGLAVSPRVVGRSGSPISERLSLYDLNIAPLVKKGAHNVIVFHAGDNDIALGSTSPAAYAALVDYVRRAHAQGWKIVVSTELQRFDFPEERRAELGALNELIRTNAAGADVVSDYAADPILGGPQNRKNPIYYAPDGIHPVANGYAILARMTASAVARALGDAAFPSCDGSEPSR
ncbi:MAG TPA: GDSL-type esterase/lipase family protein [Methylocystis sp.]|nr:GDSL-type esterase/lipase family protein [Methylocystis sp.]